MELNVVNLEKTYDDGTRALAGISFDVRPGEGVIILGHNGCGKSTLMKCLTGIENISAGNILLDKTDISQVSGRKLRSIRQRIGCVFQKFNMVGNLSVLQNVLFGLMGKKSYFSCHRAIASSADRIKAMEALDRVGLAHLAGRRTDTLSGGQQQRVAIARMLMQDAEIVFADEPVASLDPKAGHEVMELLWSVIKERNMSVICVLHQIEFARAFGQRFIGLNSGRVVFDAAAADISDKDIRQLYQVQTRQEEASNESECSKSVYNAATT